MALIMLFSLYLIDIVKLCRGQAEDVLQKGLKINYCTRQ